MGLKRFKQGVDSYVFDSDDISNLKIPPTLFGTHPVALWRELARNGDDPSSSG